MAREIGGDSGEGRRWNRFRGNDREGATRPTREHMSEGGWRRWWGGPPIALGARPLVLQVLAESRPAVRSASGVRLPWGKAGRGKLISGRQRRGARVTSKACPRPIPYRYPDTRFCFCFLFTNFRYPLPYSFHVLFSRWFSLYQVPGTGVRVALFASSFRRTFYGTFVPTIRYQVILTCTR